VIDFSLMIEATPLQFVCCRQIAREMATPVGLRLILISKLHNIGSGAEVFLRSALGRCGSWVTMPRCVAVIT